MHVLAQVSPHSWRQRGGDTIIPSSSISEATQKEAQHRKLISPGSPVGAILELSWSFFFFFLLLSDPNNYALYRPLFFNGKCGDRLAGQTVIIAVCGFSGRRKIARGKLR